jgi:hypothetical protein
LIKFFTLKNSLKKSYAIISRNIFAAFFLSLLHNQKIIYETHIRETGFFRELIQKILVKNNNVKVAVITNALKKIIISNYNLQKNNIDVYPDAAFDGGGSIDSKIKLIKRKKYFSHLVEVKNPVRYTMFLKDFEPGHIFVYDDRVAANYKAGDMFEWSDPMTLHGPANIGYNTRYTLQITMYD